MTLTQQLRYLNLILHLIYCDLAELNVVVFSQLGEVVRHSGHCEFTAAHFVPKCNTRGVTRGHNAPDAESQGAAEKSQECRKFFLQCMTFNPKIA